MKRSGLLGALALLLGACSVSLAAIAIGTTRWRYQSTSSREDGLFEGCQFSNTFRSDCHSNDAHFAEVYMRVTQVFMVTGTFLGIVGVVIALFIACGKKKRNLSIAAGILFVLSGLFLLVACSVYTGVNRPTLTPSLLRFGYSLWIAWSSAIIALFAATFSILSKPSNLGYE